MLAACADRTPGGSQPLPPTSSAQPQLRLQTVASGLSNPLYLTAPTGDPRLFVVEQQGRIRMVRNDSLLAAPFLDIIDRVSSGGERGLLSVAFHPRYAENGFFYVDYTDKQGNTRVERYQVSRDATRADPASAKLILHVDQPYPNHNGGLVVFGPDGMLYIGMGDGGGGGDPRGNGQNPATLLGKLLRIDVDAGDPYAVPRDNPFVGRGGARGEIWATGLRNPWRFAFDRTAGMLYIADVGQNEWEEIDAVRADSAGVNYGWNIMEGDHCFRPASGCNTAGLERPISEYSHSEGCSITGGYVYRGSRIPALQGHYFYADYCKGWVKSLRSMGGAVTDLREWPFGDIGNVLSFGEDAAGELYVLSANGRVYRIVSGE